jgi:hypothetical protein
LKARPAPGVTAEDAKDAEVKSRQILGVLSVLGGKVSPVGRYVDLKTALKPDTTYESKLL